MIESQEQNILRKPSMLMLLFTLCFSVFTMDLWRPWHLINKEDNQFVWDVAGYYSYLPSEFIIKDYKPNGQRFQNFLIDLPNGEKITKGTYGMALMYSPFFALGYKIAINEHKPLDGFSEPFAIALHWGSILYGLLGLLLLRNFLIKFYSEKVTTITLAIVFFGTNLLCYVLSMSEMTHGYLFFLYSAFLLTSYHWHKKPTYSKSVLIGIIVGIITLIRPTEIIVCALFLFINLDANSKFSDRIKLIGKQYPKLIIAAICAFCVWIPQLLFWKTHTGSYFFFSYPGERFFWTDPQIFNILFSYRKGWFVYTPLIVLAFIGMIFMQKKYATLRNVILIITIINIYILSCWWDWFFGGGFSGRGFVQHYAYLAIPIASLVEFLIEGTYLPKIKQWIQLLFFAIVFSGIILNIGQTFQFINGLIHYHSMTKDAYWHNFGRYKMYGTHEAKYWNILSEPDYEKLHSGENRDQ